MSKRKLNPETINELENIKENEQKMKIKKIYKGCKTS